MGSTIADLIGWHQQGSLLWKARSARAGLRLSRAPFYQRYRHPRPTILGYADRRGAVFEEHGFFYNRIPKAANSTVSFALADAIDRPKSYKKFTRPSNLSEEDILRFEKFYKFTFVRNPYSRVLSAYRDKIAPGTTRTTRRIDSFRSFCRYLRDGHLYDDAHWAPQVHLLLIPLDSFDFIGKIENIASDLPFVFEQVGLAPPDTALRRGPPPTFSAGLQEEVYDEECTSIINKLYDRDFLMLGYERR